MPKTRERKGDLRHLRMDAEWYDRGCKERHLTKPKAKRWAPLSGVARAVRAHPGCKAKPGGVTPSYSGPTRESDYFASGAKACAWLRKEKEINPRAERMSPRGKRDTCQLCGGAGRFEKAEEDNFQSAGGNAPDGVKERSITGGSNILSGVATGKGGKL